MKKVRLILDTDIGCDCDDAGAMALMHHLADNGECEVLAVTHCTSRLSGASSIDAINRYYGRPDIPVGTYEKNGFLDDKQYEKYSHVIAMNYQNRYIVHRAPDAVEVLRRTLAKEKDHSVVIAAIGPLVNLADLLTSKADGVSSLNGEELVHQKVASLCVMGGSFDKGEAGVDAEWNIIQDIAAAQKVIQLWHTPITFCPFEVGSRMLTGRKLLDNAVENNPVKEAYQLFCNGPRESWDPATVLYAVRGKIDFLQRSQSGKISIDEHGVTMFEQGKDVNHYYLKLKNCEGLRQIIDDLIY